MSGNEKIYWRIFLLRLIIFLFLAVRFSRIEKAEFTEQNNDSLVELIRVIDGDTIEVKVGKKIESVRLIGIDAPEMDEVQKEKAI